MSNKDAKVTKRSRDFENAHKIPIVPSSEDH